MRRVLEWFPAWPNVRNTPCEIPAAARGKKFRPFACLRNCHLFICCTSTGPLVEEQKIADIVFFRTGYVCSFLRRASRRAAPAKVPPRCLGAPSRVSGDTRVVSTASWFPPHNGRPLAMTSILLASWRSRCSRLRSTTRVFVVTRAPALCGLLPVPGPPPWSQESRLRTSRAVVAKRVLSATAPAEADR